jgi:hypothetical protein
VEESQQGDGVRPSGTGHDHGRTGRKETLGP